MSLNVILVIANSVYTDEMQHYAAFHLDLHCFPKYPLGVSSIQRVKIRHFFQNYVEDKT